MVYGQSRNPLQAAIQQAVEKQKQEEQMKMQLLQMFGFGQNPLPMNALPRNAGVVAMDGQVLTRPGGSDQKTMQLISALLGLNVGGARGMQPANTGTFGLERPGPVTEQPGNNDSGYVQNLAQTSQDNKDDLLWQFLLRNYAQYIPNSGMTRHNLPLGGL